jgi:hypothetical protein
MTYIRDNKKPVYLSTEVYRWLQLLAKADRLYIATESRMGTADEVADQILRQAIREQHPQLSEHQKAIDAAEKKLVDTLRHDRYVQQPEED